jgi:CRP-like cAMP-binding protein
MGNICSSDDGGGSSKGKHQMSPRQRAFIIKCFKNDAIITKTNIKENIGALIDALEYKEYHVGSYVFKEGDPGDKLFFLAFGSVDIISDSGKEYNALKKGQFFGQYGFFNGKKRSASAMSTKACGVYSINQKLWNLNTCNQILHPKHLLQFDVFYDFTDTERAQIFSKLVRVEYEPNDVIVKTGDVVKGLFIVTNGEICWF